MRHRHALVAYEQSDRTYELHRSQRLGRDLHEAWRISESTSFGYAHEDEEAALIDPEPLDSGWKFHHLVDDLDYARFSAIVLVSQTLAVTPYRALWFGFADLCPQVVDCSHIGNGVLVRVDDVHEHPERDVALCARFDATKRTLARLVDGGQVSLDAAQSHLRAHVADLQVDREVVRPDHRTQTDRSQHADPPSLEPDVLERWLDPSTAYHDGGEPPVEGRRADSGANEDTTEGHE